MPLVADRCICVRRIEYSETSQILTLFGRTHGLVRVIAKGAHRTTKTGASKFGGGIDLLDVADAVFSLALHKDLAPLAEWTLISGQRAIRSNLRAIRLGEYAAELVAALIEEHDPHADLFDAFERMLAELATPRSEGAFVAFELRLLLEAGLLPEISVCVSCGRSMEDAGPRAYFSARSGGVLCRDCEATLPDRTEIDGRVLRPMRTILGFVRENAPPTRLPILSRHASDPINRMIGEHVEYVSGKRLRVLRYIR